MKALLRVLIGFLFYLKLLKLFPEVISWSYFSVVCFKYFFLFPLTLYSKLDNPNNYSRNKKAKAESVFDCPASPYIVTYSPVSSKSDLHTGETLWGFPATVTHAHLSTCTHTKLTTLNEKSTPMIFHFPQPKTALSRRSRQIYETLATDVLLPFLNQPSESGKTNLILNLLLL